MHFLKNKSATSEDCDIEKVAKEKQQSPQARCATAGQTFQQTSGEREHLIYQNE